MAQNKANQIRVFAPASVANVGCGFDVMGFAIHEPGDEVVARITGTQDVVIAAIHGDDGKLPMKTEKNTAGVAVQVLLEALKTKPDFGIELEIFKKMPLGSGLGSSAASSVAAAVAVNRLLGDPFSKKELLPFVTEAERVASGEPHADNVAAALLGGFIFVRSNDPLDVIQLNSPDHLYCTVIHPHIEIRTEDTRKILRKEIPLTKAVKQWGNVGALVAGLLTGDIELIARSLHDEIIEPIRSVLIPAYDEIKKAALDAGALGCCISGSGPSVFALSISETKAHAIGKAMERELSSIGLEGDIYVSAVNKRGCRIIEE